MRSFVICSAFAVVLLVTALVAVPCWGAINTEIAISSQTNWWGQAAGDREMNEIVDNVGRKVKDIQIFPAAKQSDLADWVKDHTGNRQLDVLILCGQFPDTIYKPGNAEADGSIAEEFLEAGNMIINTGDYMFYVVNAAGTNGAAGLQSMMDIPSITMWDDNTSVEVTDEGKKYLPSLRDFQTDRPFHLDELQDPWETEIIFAGDDRRADSVVVKDTGTDGRLVIFYQTASQDADPRGEVMSEFILNWLPEIVGGVAVEPEGKLGAAWGQLKASN